VDNQIGDVLIQIERGNSKNHRSDLIDNIDLAVYFSWPFVVAEHTSSNNLRFTKSDGSSTEVNISQTENGGPNYTKITVQDKVFQKQGKEEDSEIISGLIGSFAAFYKSVKFNVVEDQDTTLAYWTYNLLEKMR